MAAGPDGSSGIPKKGYKRIVSSPAAAQSKEPVLSVLTAVARLSFTGTDNSADPDQGYAAIGCIGTSARRIDIVALRRGIVDAISGHGNDAPLLLELADDLRLFVGQDSGFEFFDTELLSYGFGSSWTVAGQHEDLQAFGF